MSSLNLFICFVTSCVLKILVHIYLFLCNPWWHPFKCYLANKIWAYHIFAIVIITAIHCPLWEYRVHKNLLSGAVNERNDTIQPWIEMVALPQHNISRPLFFFTDYTNISTFVQIPDVSELKKATTKTTKKKRVKQFFQDVYYCQSLQNTATIFSTLGRQRVNLGSADCFFDKLHVWVNLSTR